MRWALVDFLFSRTVAQRPVLGFRWVRARLCPENRTQPPHAAHAGGQVVFCRACWSASKRFRMPFLLTFRVQLCKLLLIKLLDRELNGQERVQKASVLLASILRDDRSAFRLDESSLYQFCHIFSHGVRTHIDGFTNRFVACMALICRPILSVHQIAVDSNAPGERPRAKTSFGRGK